MEVYPVCPLNVMIMLCRGRKTNEDGQSLIRKSSSHSWLCIRVCLVHQHGGWQPLISRSDIIARGLLQESQGLTIYAFVMLLLMMISVHMLTFRLMVTMVAEFCPLVIIIHNALLLLEEITIGST